jgi:uncharacterized protein
MARFVYPIKDLEDSVREVREPLPPTWLAKILEETDVTPSAEDGLLEASLTVTGRNVLVRGMVRTTVLVPCARCLQPSSFPIEGELALLLVPDKPPKGKSPNTKGNGEKKQRSHAVEGDDDGYQIEPGETELDTYTGDEVVLDGFVREAILLELPIFPLCSEACPGIGALPSETAEPATEESQIDPRLAPLLELKNKSKV